MIADQPQLSTLFPLLYTLLTVAASHQLGFVRYHADAVMGFRLFGMPVEEIASVRFPLPVGVALANVLRCAGQSLC